mmetsp:Transcript_149933/g.417778  ORF Transcript_149933/g.417778 Transcript_149933/m.417778 type:complete len:466 (-) Transcript_149933:387-1784(-)
MYSSGLSRTRRRPCTCDGFALSRGAKVASSSSSCNLCSRRASAEASRFAWSPALSATQPRAARRAEEGQTRGRKGNSAAASRGGGRDGLLVGLGLPAPTLAARRPPPRPLPRRPPLPPWRRSAKRMERRFSSGRKGGAWWASSSESRRLRSSSCVPWRSRKLRTAACLSVPPAASTASPEASEGGSLASGVPALCGCGEGSPVTSGGGSGGGWLSREKTSKFRYASAWRMCGATSFVLGRCGWHSAAKRRSRLRQALMPRQPLASNSAESMEAEAERHWDCTESCKLVALFDRFGAKVHSFNSPSSLSFRDASARASRRKAQAGGAARRTVTSWLVLRRPAPAWRPLSRFGRKEHSASSLASCNRRRRSYRWVRWMPQSSLRLENSESSVEEELQELGRKRLPGLRGAAPSSVPQRRRLPAGATAGELAALAQPGSQQAGVPRELGLLQGQPPGTGPVAELSGPR